jgi:hypothetical protein
MPHDSSPCRPAKRRGTRGTRNTRPARQLALEQLEDRCLLSGDMVLAWNAIAIEAAKSDHAIGAPGAQFGPTRTSRAMAIVQGAVYDAVNSIQPLYTPYLVQVEAPRDASIDAAVAEAAHDTLVSLYPYLQSYFDTQLASSLQGIPLNRAAEGVAVGAVVAQCILAARADDGSQIDAPGHQPPYTYGQLPGQWRADPLHPDATPLTPDWGGVTPFVMQSRAQFEAPPPPAITSQAYANAYEEVKAVGAMNSPVRTDTQTDVGLFWGYDAQPGLCAPIRFYNQIGEVIAQQEGNTEVENARFFALINFAMADAAITCWGDKYAYDLWRPVTAIRENDPNSPSSPTGLGSGNPFLVGQGDPTWQPFGAPADNGNGTNFTPPFPSYTSGHATFGGALFKMIGDFYGTDNIRFTVVSDEFNTITVDQNGKPRPLMPRTYDSLSQAAGENAQSRIYLGIHYHFDAVEGIRCGDAIADYVFTHSLLPEDGRHLRPIASMDPEAQIQLAIRLEDVAGNGGLPGRHLTTGLADRVFGDFDDGSDRHGRSDGADGHGRHDRVEPVAVFKAEAVNGSVVLATTDGEPFDQGLSTHPAGTTIPTTATGTRDAATLARDLILYLNKGVWGGANRGGHTLVVDLDARGGDLFVVL